MMHASLRSRRRTGTAQRHLDQAKKLRFVYKKVKKNIRKTKKQTEKNEKPKKNKEKLGKTRKNQKKQNHSTPAFKPLSLGFADKR